MVKIVTLTDDYASVKKGVIGEHGLSFYIEADGKRLLFDTGQTFTAVHNAHILGVDLKKIDMIILSHGHYDHTGGLKSILNELNAIDILVHPDVFQKKVFLNQDGSTRDIGIPYSAKELQRWGANLLFSTQPVKITENIILSGQIPLVNDFEKIDNKMQVETENGLEKDCLLDDRALFIKTTQGLLVILGCAHRGMINTIEYGMNLTGEKRLFGVMGGSHLVAADEYQIQKTIHAMGHYKPNYIGLCHCTGFEAALDLYHNFPQIWEYNYCGMSYIFDIDC